MYERDGHTQRHAQTHTAWQHRPRLHSIARQKLAHTCLPVSCYTLCLKKTRLLRLLCPRPRRGGGGIRQSSASVVRLSVRPSVCLMSRTSALTRKPKGLGRRNFAQGYPQVTCDSHTDFKVKSQGGVGAYCGGDLAAQLVMAVCVTAGRWWPVIFRMHTMHFQPIR